MDGQQATTPQTAAEWILYCRDRSGMSQLEFSNPIGLTSAAISAIETGHTLTPRRKTKRLIVQRINEILGTKFEITDIFPLQPGERPINFSFAAPLTLTA